MRGEFTPPFGLVLHRKRSPPHAPRRHPAHPPPTPPRLLLLDRASPSSRAPARPAARLAPPAPARAPRHATRPSPHHPGHTAAPPQTTIPNPQRSRKSPDTKKTIIFLKGQSGGLGRRRCVGGGFGVGCGTGVFCFSLFVRSELLCALSLRS